MTFGLVNVSFSLPEWQAVKMTFFAPWLTDEQLKNITEENVPIEMSVYPLRFCLKQCEEYMIYNLPYFETCTTEVKFYGVQYLDMGKNYCYGRGDLPLRVGVHHYGYHFGIRTKTGTVKKR